MTPLARQPDRPESAGTHPAAPSRRMKQHARAHFERWALSYDRSWLNELVFFPAARACQAEIARWQTPRGDAPFHVLDVGCGTGSLLTLLAHDARAERLVGLDYTEAMIRRAAEKFEQSKHACRLQAIRGDSERLPFPEHSFDVVTCCNSLHHYPHQSQAVRGFRRVLRPGGLLVLIDGFRDNVIGWVVFDVGVALIEKHVHHASWSEVRGMIRDAGFTELRQQKLNVLAPLLINVARVAE